MFDGVVHLASLPSVSQINKVIRKDLVMTRKKITGIPLESTTPETTWAIDDFLTEIASLKNTVHRKQEILGEPHSESLLWKYIVTHLLQIYYKSFAPILTARLGDYTC